MWCKCCQQDVPAVVLADSRGYGCPRCSTPMNDQPAPGTEDGSREAGADRHREVERGSHDSLDGDYDAWELEERLRHIQRVLRVDAETDGAQRADSPAGQPVWRIDAAHERPSAPHRRKKRRKQAAAARKPGPLLSLVTWTALSFGMMALACGGVLLGWSVLGARQELWAIGLPIALAGQVLLLIGFVLQIDRLRLDNRDTASKLHAVDERLDDLKSTTSLLGSTHSPPAASFYAHFAAGASPQILLSDLKGQLDLLAVRISQDEL